MSFAEGCKVKIGAAGVSEFIVTEVGYSGEPDLVLIKPVLEAGYEFPIRAAALVIVGDGSETS